MKNVNNSLHLIECIFDFLKKNQHFYSKIGIKKAALGCFIKYFYIILSTIHRNKKFFIGICLIHPVF
jgi:hypothetical protein